MSDVDNLDDLEELESLKPLDSLLSDLVDHSVENEQTTSITEIDQNSMLTLAIPERIITDQTSPLNEYVTDKGFNVTALDQNQIYRWVGNFTDIFSFRTNSSITYRVDLEIRKPFIFRVFKFFSKLFQNFRYPD